MRSVFAVVFVAIIGAIFLIHTSSDSPIETLESDWTPGLDSSTSRYFKNLQSQLAEEKTEDKNIQSERAHEDATNVLEIAPPRRFNERSFARGPIRPVYRAETEDLAATSQPTATSHNSEDDDIYNLAEANLNDEPLGPIAKESRNVKKVSLDHLMEKLRRDQARERQDKREIEQASAGKNRLSILANMQPKSESEESDVDTPPKSSLNSVESDVDTRISPQSNSEESDVDTPPKSSLNSVESDVDMGASSHSEESDVDTPPKSSLNSVQSDVDMGASSHGNSEESDVDTPPKSSLNSVQYDVDMGASPHSEESDIDTPQKSGLNSVQSDVDMGASPQGNSEESDIDMGVSSTSLQSLPQPLAKSNAAAPKVAASKVSSGRLGASNPEIQKTSDLLRSVGKLLGKKIPSRAYIRPMSTALVARELGEAIDKHEVCRRKLRIAEHHLMAVEEKAKTAMREAREADAGMAKALKMVKKAEDLVELAREEHENYVQDVRDSLDVRNQYTEEALQTHTLLEHMSRLKNRYDKAVQVLTRDQVKYNKLLRKIENKTDKKANLRQDVSDDKEELLVLGDSDSDAVKLSTEGISPKDQELAEEPFKETEKIFGFKSKGSQSRLLQLKKRAKLMSKRAHQVFQTLPEIELEASKYKRDVNIDKQLLVEAMNDRALTKGRMSEGGMSNTMKVDMGEITEEDTRRIDHLRHQLELARARLRAARHEESMGPEFEREAIAAQHNAKHAAFSSQTNFPSNEKNSFFLNAKSNLNMGIGAFMLPSIAAQIVPLSLASTVAQQVMSTGESATSLKQQILTTTQELATTTQDLSAIRAQAKHLRSQMKIKRQIANDARKDYEKARNQYEHAARRVQPLEAELHDRSKGIQESRQNAEIALEKAQQHLISTRRTARYAAKAKLAADRYLRRVRQNLYEKQEVVKNMASCQQGSWFKIKDLTDKAKLHNIIGDGESDMGWTSPSDLASNS